MKLDIYQFSEDLARFSEQFLVRLLLSSKIAQFTCEIIKSLLLLKALNFDNCGSQQQNRSMSVSKI